MQARTFRTITLAAAAVGVVVRAVYVLTAVRNRIALDGDARTYHWLGRVLADGRGYIRASDYFFFGDVIPTAEFPPAYPLLLGVLDLVGIDSPTGQRLAGAVLGGVTIVVIGLFGAAVAGRVVGAVAAWIAALYPQLVVFDGALLSEGLYVLLIATALLGVVRARAAAEPEARRRWWILAGVAIGLAVMTRSEAVLLLPLVAIPATRVAGDPRAWARNAPMVSAATLVLVGAWTVRNAIVLDHFVPLTNNSGTLLSGANCDEVYGRPRLGRWQFECVTAIYPEGLDETDAAAELRAAGIEYAVDHAGEVPKVVAVRVARTFGMWDIRTGLSFERLEGHDLGWLWAAWVVWLTIGSLAVVGFATRRRSGREVWPLVVPLAIVVVTSAVGYGNQRFRMIAEPGMVVLAAIGVVAISSWVAAARGRPAQTHDPAGSS